MNKVIEIPEGYKARIEGNEVILELKESEEERIYNLICSSIKNEIPISHSRNKELALAYLEKQKEQKPMNNPKWNELTWKDINDIEEIINQVHYEFSNGISAEGFGTEVLEQFRNIKEDAKVDACEQKHAEWSKEDESMHTRTLGALGKCLFANLPVEVKEEIDWLKELPNRFNLQPKTEKLSNEEKEKIQSICDFLWKNRRGDTDTIYRMEQYINWLMKLIKE